MIDKRMSFTLFVERPPSDVFAAVTESAQLEKWLAAKATVEAREGGKFEIASGTPLCTGKHTIRKFVRDEMLHIDWVLEGVTTYFALEFRPERDGTRVAFSHGFPADVPFDVDDEFGTEAGVFAEMWAYNAGLLKTYLELGEAKCRLATDRTPAPRVTHVMTVQVAPQRVFRALVEPEEIRKWNPYAKGASVDPQVGGRYSFGWDNETKGKDGPDEIVEYEQDRKITYTWHGDPRTLVSWTVEPLPGSERATRLTLVHSGFVEDQNMLVGYNLGWAAFLHAIVLFLERATEPDWLDYQ